MDSNMKRDDLVEISNMIVKISLEKEPDSFYIYYFVCDKSMKINSKYLYGYYTDSVIAVKEYNNIVENPDKYYLDVRLDNYFDALHMKDDNYYQKEEERNIQVKMKKLSDASMPLLKFYKESCNLHESIIINEDGVKIIQDQIFIPMKIEDET